MNRRLLVVAFAAWAGLLAGFAIAHHPLLITPALWGARAVALGAGWVWSEWSNIRTETGPDLLEYGGRECPRAEGTAGGVARPNREVKA